MVTEIPTRLSALLLLHSLVASAFVVVPRAPSFAIPSTSHSISFSSTALPLSPPTYEALVEKLPSKSVIEVVEKAPDRKVVAADIAASAGVSLSQARKDLTALASISQGDIAVSKDGELIYEFPPNLNAVLSSNSIKYKTRDALMKIWPGLFYVLRVSFGVALLASIAAIYSTIFFLSSQSSSSDDDRRRDSRGGSMGFGGPSYSIWGPSPFDFLYYRPYYGYYAAPGRPARDPDEMGFLESVFSYIFCDGNPNEGLEERRLSLAANRIRDNGGSVTAEQLAPFCDEAPPPNTRDESSYIDESFVLPIVSQLNGEPQVTDDGDIVYVFPEMQVSAVSSPFSSTKKKTFEAGYPEASILQRAGLDKNADSREIQQLLRLNGISTKSARDKKDLVRILERALPPMTKEEEASLLYQDPTLLQEREYEFSLANPFNRILAGGLGIVNLLGALYLGNMLSTYALYGVQLPSYFGLVQAGFPLLLGYAVLFNVIPLVRSFWIRTENEKIRRRNKTRRLWKEMLEKNVFTQLGRKLKAAQNMGGSMKQLGESQDEIVFDTKQSIDEIAFAKSKDQLDLFDRLLDKEDENK